MTRKRPPRPANPAVIPSLKGAQRGAFFVRKIYKKQPQINGFFILFA